MVYATNGYSLDVKRRLKTALGAKGRTHGIRSSVLGYLVDIVARMFLDYFI